MTTALKILTAGALCCTLSFALASPDVRISEDHGFIDIDLPITAMSDNDGLVKITSRGSVDGTEVGFEVDFASKGGSGVRSNLPVGVARIRSIGVPSDHFVMLLAQRYRLPMPAPRMVSSIDASMVGLEGDPQHVLDRTTKMKFFFFDSGPEERYAEVFINVDAKNRILEFHEKDEDYRKPLLLDLTKGS